jgi:PPOX class probable F420-dependent enzyme
MVKGSLAADPKDAHELSRCRNAARSCPAVSAMNDAIGGHGQPAGRPRRTPETVIGIQGRDGAIKVTVTGLATGGRRDIPADPSGRSSVADRWYREETADGSYFTPLAEARYLLLTTFKQKGTPVSAPVQGIVDGDRAYLRVWSQSGTVRRLRHTDGVQVAPCGALGLCSHGPPLDAAARRLAGEEASRVAGQLARKYPVRRRSLARLLQRARRRRLVYYELLP